MSRESGEIQLHTEVDEDRSHSDLVPAMHVAVGHRGRHQGHERHRAGRHRHRQAVHDGRMPRRRLEEPAVTRRAGIAIAVAAAVWCAAVFGYGWACNHGWAERTWQRRP
ncbi:MAG: hypothetical protein ACRDXE_07450 [Acidimicrobiales bacterium]